MLRVVAVSRLSTQGFKNYTKSTRKTDWSYWAFLAISLVGKSQVTAKTLKVSVLPSTTTFQSLKKQKVKGDEKTVLYEKLVNSKVGDNSEVRWNARRDH